MLGRNRNQRDCITYFHDIQCIGDNCHLKEKCRRWWPKYEPKMKTYLDENGFLQCTGMLENKTDNSESNLGGN